jgi:predicted porin
LSVSGKTRQNDLDVAFTLSFQPGASTTSAADQDSQEENRQAFLTFGDASWGSIKLGKDLGIYASDAILNDMTLLGVGAGAGNLAGNTTTLGRIGTGFIYADWKAQVAYTSPNFNGLQFTAGVTQAWNASAGGFGGATNSLRGGNEPAFEGKASYAFAADAVNAKVWASGISQKVDGVTAGTGGTVAAADVSSTVTAWDIGANVSAAGFGLTGYYGEGKGIGQTMQLVGGFDKNGQKRDSEQYYVQATYALPGVGTKLGVSYGENELKGNTTGSVDAFNDVTDQMIVLGVYHPITKHLNLVAEYAETERNYDAVSSASDAKAKAKTVSLGAILFF